jgi:hypothetical protein
MKMKYRQPEPKPEIDDPSRGSAIWQLGIIHSLINAQLLSPTLRKSLTHKLQNIYVLTKQHAP